MSGPHTAVTTLGQTVSCVSGLLQGEKTVIHTHRGYFIGQRSSAGVRQVAALTKLHTCKSKLLGRRHVCLKPTANISSKRLSNPITGLGSPRGFQEIEAPRYQDSRHMNVARLSALRTGRLYTQEIFLYSFLLRAESIPGPQCGRKDYVNEKFQ